MTVIKNDRVMNILALIEKFKACDVTHIARLYYPKTTYSMKNAQDKLTKLTKEKTLKRRRSDINSRYYYWIGKEPAQVQHKLLLTELYVKFCHVFSNTEVIPEYTGLSGIRPDALVKVTINRRIYLYFVEIHISNNPFDSEKYERAYQANKHEKAFPDGIFPTVIVVSSKKLQVKGRNVSYVVTGLDINLNWSVLYEKAN